MSIYRFGDILGEILAFVFELPMLNFIFVQTTIVTFNLQLLMKKMIILAAALLLGIAAFAQNPHKVYCMFTSETRVLSYDIEVDMDYGQALGAWGSTDRRLFKEDGKSLKFNSVMDAVNFLAGLGWELEQSSQLLTPINGSSENPSYRWVMSKMITDNAQITEGLTTGAMLK